MLSAIRKSQIKQRRDWAGVELSGRALVRHALDSGFDLQHHWEKQGRSLSDNIKLNLEGNKFFVCLFCSTGA
jgi:hypothetical protein